MILPKTASDTSLNPSSVVLLATECSMDPGKISRRIVQRAEVDPDPAPVLVVAVLVKLGL
jgi:hypothetical protein